MFSIKTWNCLCVSLLLTFSLPTLAKNIKCIENGRFYRDPERPIHTVWTQQECSKYFLCLDGELFEFTCSAGLLFDVNRQMCDFKANVENCDVVTEPVKPVPLLKKANCREPSQLGCADGTCLPDEYFCDGSLDCTDGSDEVHCEKFNDPHAATPCDTTSCRLPACFCSKDGKQIPGNLEPSAVPQMVLLSFDDAVNSDNWSTYARLLLAPQRRNPNNCPIQATFFVSHQFNNYQLTQKLWNIGHEIAVHSVTHRGPETWWSRNATIEDWFDEMIGQANILNRFSSVRMEEIRGVRVPFLRVGWNRQFLMMKEFGFVYDSSMIAPMSDPPFWPYTLDHKMPHKCTGHQQNCPTRPYASIWEMVINELDVDGYVCDTLPTCRLNFSGENVYKILMHNFKRHYYTNRAPFGLHLNSKLLQNAEYLSAIETFFDFLATKTDVWFVTNTQAIKWMQKPTRSDRAVNFEPWKCNKHLKRTEIACNLPNICKVYSRVFQQDRYFYSCSECPEKYPWVRNEFGVD